MKLFYNSNDAQTLPCGCIEVHHSDVVHEFFEAPSYRNSRLPISPDIDSPCIDPNRFHTHGGLLSSFFSLLGFKEHHHHHHLHELGDKVHIHRPTGGFFTTSGLIVDSLLARYVAALIARPLLTKAYTAGTLSFLQEIITNHIAGVKFHTECDAPAYKRFLARLKIDSAALKMFAYGFFVSAPLGHYLNLMMIKLFAGRTSRKARFSQFLMQFFFVAPINVVVYLISMAVIGGAKSQTHIRTHVHRGFAKMLAFTWLVQPTALFAARRWIPIELWSPFFQLVNFSIGTYFLAKVKKIQVLKAGDDDRGKKREPYRPGPNVIVGGASASANASGYNAQSGYNQSSSSFTATQGGYTRSEQHSTSQSQEVTYTQNSTENRITS